MTMKSNKEINPLPVEITISICTHNRGKMLVESAEKIVDACYGKEWVNVLIVDNASTDDTDEAILSVINYGKKKSVRVTSVFESNLGLSAARNRALDECRTTVIAFIDDDAYIDAAWCDAVRSEFIANDETVGCGGPVVPIYSVPKPNWLSNRLLWAYSVGGHGNKDRLYAYPEHPLGVNMAFKISKISGLRFNENLGRKGESLVSWEESEYFRKIMKDGGRIKYLSGAVVYHIIPESRLTKRWLMRRHVAEGRSVALALIADPNTKGLNIANIVKGLFAAFSLLILSALNGHTQTGVFFRMKSIYHLSKTLEHLISSHD